MTQTLKDSEERSSSLSFFLRLAPMLVKDDTDGRVSRRDRSWW